MGTLHNIYKDKGNALAAWDAYKIARDLKMKPIPEWVLEYLDETAFRLLKSDRKIRHLARCLQFPPVSGGPGVFKQYLSERVKITAILAVFEAHNGRRRMTYSKAFSYAADEVSKRWPQYQDGKKLYPSTIKRWFWKMTKINDI